MNREVGDPLSSNIDKHKWKQEYVEKSGALHQYCFTSDIQVLSVLSVFYK